LLRRVLYPHCLHISYTVIFFCFVSDFHALSSTLFIFM
jgi:hypothetical protein